MKKLITTIAAGFLLSITAFSQTNTFPTTGNAGVGTITPATTLQVVGITRMGGTADYGQFNTTGDLTFTGNGDFLVGGDEYAFRYQGNENFGLVFSATNSRYEFRDGSAAQVFWVTGGGVGYVKSKLAIGSTTTPGASLDITPTNAAAIRINPFGTSAGNTGDMRFSELVANGTNYVGFKAPDNISNNKTWVLPSADGTSGQYLKTDGAGNLGWATDANTTYTAGTGINITGTTITNTSPDQTVTITGGGGTSVTGTYPNFTVTSTAVTSNKINDADNDTKVETESSPDEDKIRFTTGGTKYFTMNKATLEVDNSGKCVYLGTAAGLNDTYSGFAWENQNTGIGSNTLQQMTTGTDNTALGYGSLQNNITGYNNTAIGSSVLRNNTSYNNTAIGKSAGLNNISGNTNTFLGMQAGYNNNGSGNVFIGKDAGYFEGGSDKLYIDNSFTGSPLIYGDFATNTVTINSNLSTASLQITNDADEGDILKSDEFGNAYWVEAASIETDPSVTAENENYVPRWDGSSLADGTIYDDGNNIGINNDEPEAKLDVYNNDPGSHAIIGYYAGTTSGTSWTDGNNYNGIKGVTESAELAEYQAGVYGYAAGSGNNTGGVVGAWDEVTWTGLGYKDNEGDTWGLHTVGNTKLQGELTIDNGSQGEGFILTSDEDGVVSWKDPSEVALTNGWEFDGDNIYNSNAGVVSIGSAGGDAAFNVYNNISIDNEENNNGDLSSGALTFGFGISGEGIASKRTSGGNQYGLDLYTGGINRISINEEGRVGVGTSEPGEFNDPTFNYPLMMMVSENNDITDLNNILISDDDFSPWLNWGKARGTMASPTAVQENDQLFVLNAAGHDGTTYFKGATIEVNVDGSVSGSSVPGRIIFSTTVEGSDSPEERMRITNNGNIGIGTSEPEQTLDVNGTTKTTQFQMTEGAVEDYVLRSDVDGNASWVDPSSLVNGDNLGDHTATENIRTNGFYLSNDGNSEGVYVSTSGNVGIGTTSPNIKLHVPGSSDAGFSSGSGLFMIGDIASTNIVLDNNEIMARSNGAESPLYMQNDGGDFHMHFNQAGGSQFTVLDNGNVGIGNAAPAYLLDIQSSSAAASNIQSSASTTYISASSPSAMESAMQFKTYSAGTLKSRWQMGKSNGSESGSNAGSDFFINSYNDAGTFLLQPFMIKRSTGYVGIGNTSPGSKLFVQESVSSSNYIATVYNAQDVNTVTNNGLLVKAGHSTFTTNSSRLIAFQNPSGSAAGTVFQTGTTAVTYSTTSDERLKENIRDTKFGLGDLMKIQVSDYNYKDEQAPQTGYIAQQLYTVYPNAVHVGGDDAKEDPWMVDYGMITPLLVKSIQDLSLEVDSIEAAPQHAVGTNAIADLQQQLNEKDDLIAGQQLQINDLSNKLDEVLNKMLEMESSLSACCTAYGYSDEAPLLEQNVPNPFMETSYIKFYIPSNAGSATIAVSDMYGKPVKQFSGLAHGYGTVTIDAGLLTAGTYQYTLVIDGKMIDTKQMVLTK